MARGAAASAGHVARAFDGARGVGEQILRALAHVDRIGGGNATLTVTPKKMGKTTIGVKLAGGNSVSYTAYVTNTISYVAKGTKTTLAKPVGVKKLTFADKTAKPKKLAQACRCAPWPAPTTS